MIWVRTASHSPINAKVFKAMLYEDVSTYPDHGRYVYMHRMGDISHYPGSD